MMIALLLICLVSLISHVDCLTCKYCAAGHVTIQNGAYEGILIAIDNRIEYHPSIISNIQNYFQSASEALFNATKHVSGRYFGEITVLVPSHWPEENTTGATTESIQQAIFTVEPDSKEWGSKPYTVRLLGDCGSPGKKTVLPESFVQFKQEAEIYGKVIGNTIVKEWAFLRYGLFDESVDEDGNTEFTCGANEMIPRCPLTINGDTITRGDAVSCKFTPHDRQPGGASHLYESHFDSVYSFCDDKAGNGSVLHNPEAKNLHNTRCNRRSAWSIMRDHQDFAKTVREAKRVHPVKFRIVRDNTLRISIVLDVSGSMSSHSRLQWMQQNVKNFLHNLLRTTKLNKNVVMVGMTMFSGIATKLQDIVILNDTSVITLINAIPTNVGGGTSIGAGIREGLKVLAEKSKRSLLVVFTDGEENGDPLISAVRDEVCEYNATVYSMLVSQLTTNHSLIALSDETCGGSCIYDDKASTTMYDCLWNAVKTRLPQLAPAVISAKVVEINGGQSFSDRVTVDSVYSSSVVFKYEWAADSATNNKCELITVNLLTPDGQLINKYNTTNYEQTRTSVEIHANFEKAGKWNYTIINPSQVKCDVRVTVEGYSNGEEKAVEMTVQLSKSVLNLDPAKDVEDNIIAIYAEIKKGTTPIVGAQVRAIITRDEDKRQWTVELLDNGAGADVRQSDGIYSRYLTEFDKDGTYKVRVEAIGEDGQVMLIEELKNRREGSQKFWPGRKSSKIKLPDGFIRISDENHLKIRGHDKLVGLNNWIYPPCKITDLRVFQVDTDEDGKTFAIKWTAVGAYLDRGNATFYDVRLGSDALQLQQNFNQMFQVNDTLILTGSLYSPKPAGEMELMIISLKDTKFAESNQQFYVAVVAVNGNGQSGKVSNVVKYQPRQQMQESQLPSWPMAVLASSIAGSVTTLAIVLIKRGVATSRRVRGKIISDP